MQQYWENLGYRIGGPICVSYSRWIIDELSKYPEINTVFFTSRDGWIIKQIFELFTENKYQTRYIYVSRELASVCCDQSLLSEYSDYLGDVQKQNIAIVDSITMRFSSQNLIEKTIGKSVLGLYWCVLNSVNNYQQTMKWASFQRAHFYTIRNWNFVEYILSSPEPPVMCLLQGKPVFQEPSEFELRREWDYRKIETGILSYTQDFMLESKNTFYSNHQITRTINDFLKHPNNEDIEQFEGVLFSEDDKHLDEKPLDPFWMHNKAKKQMKWIRDFLYLSTIRCKPVYFILHYLNKLCCKVKYFFTVTLK